jgi:cyclophilin family peptidyl-prolyl cis-trans isomerase
VKRLFVGLLALALLSAGACSAPPPTPKNAANPVVALDTSMGKIYIEIWEDKAPVTAKNFMRYVDEKFYDGTIFHRVIADFMIQGGGFTPGMNREKETHEPIVNESGETPSNKRGTIAMARTDDPDSATAQFFINVKDNPSLNARLEKPGYATFGEVLEGMDVVDAIKGVRTRTLRGQSDVPQDDVLILTARRVETEKK